ncbi:MAG TPA: hypothetical protein VGL72_05670 [Bryobacteraceae bacterium]|jgi:hypothetical protein
MLLLMITMATLCLSALALVFMVLQKIQADDSLPTEILSQESLSARYRPMFRLLDESDCGFIASELAGKTSLRHFRAERRSLFRVYLRNLGADHARIVSAIRDLLVASQQDRPDLAKALFRCQFMFALAMASVECKLLLHTIGVGTVDVRSLVAAVEGLQLQFQDMVFVQAVG